MKKAGSPGKETRLFPKKWFSAAVLAVLTGAVLAILAGTVLTVLTGAVLAVLAGAVLAVLAVLAGTVLTILTGAVLLIGIRRIVHQGFTSLVVLLWENFRPIMRPKRRFFAHRFFCFEKRRKGNVSRKIFAADERDAGPRI